MDNGSQGNRDSVVDVMNANKEMHEENAKQDEITLPEETNIQNTSVSNIIGGIYIDTEAVYNKANELSTVNENIGDEFQNLIQTMTNLDNNWNCSAADNAISSFESIKTDMNSREAEMNNHINILKNVVAPGYEDTETTNTNLANAFK